MKKVMLYIGLLTIILFISVSSYFWYIYFLDLGSDGTLTKNNIDSSIILKDESKIYAIYEDNSSSDNVLGYRFLVSNVGIKAGTYRLKLVVIDPTKVNDGCTPQKTLNKEDIDYELLLNGEKIKSGNLKDLDSSNVDERILKIDETNKYELKSWINNNAKNYAGKHFHYKIQLEVLENA